MCSITCRNHSIGAAVVDAKVKLVSMVTTMVMVMVVVVVVIVMAI